MRVSDKQRYDQANHRVDVAKTGNSAMLEQLSTQKRVNRVSDDPIAVGQILRRRSQLSDIQQFTKNIEFTKGYIDRTESSLQGIHDFLIRAKELAVSLSNGTYAENSREAAGLEVQQILEGVVSLANSQYNNRYVFGGFRTQTPPVTGEGQFTGDDGAIYLQIDTGKFKQINLQARGLFQPNADERNHGHFGMIEGLQLLRDALGDNDVPGIRKAMDELEFQMDKTTSAQAVLGATYNAIEETSRRLDLNDELTQEDLSRLEDADVYKATTDFKQTESVLQSTLMASNKLLQPSLLNFLQ
ncbi:MAG: flagellar hook-associated protein FlgL [Bdellovibrionota bacterium]|nr:MAG: flagellar hook-associated protein 3 [Pseudomonadota bacterium]